MAVLWMFKLVLISILVVAAYSSVQYCSDILTLETRQCNNFKISKLKFGEYPVNSTSLEHLYINYAGLKEMEFNVFHSIHRLQLIDLRDNLIEFLDFRLFENLEGLNYLYLSRNKLQRLSDGGLFQAQRNLIELDLSMNKLVFLNFSVLDPLRALKHFNMSENPFDCNCEIWNTIVWCKNKSLGTGAFCETPNRVAWSTWSNTDLENKCPFSNDPNHKLLIVCIVLVVIFVTVCIILFLVFLYFRNKRKRGSNKINVALNPHFVRPPGKKEFHEDVMNSVRKSYLSVIPEGTECSSRVPSSCHLDLDTGSVAFEELNETQPAQFEAQHSSKYVNIHPKHDTATDKTHPHIPVTPVANINSEIPFNVSIEYPLYSEPNTRKNTSFETKTAERSNTLPSMLTIVPVLPQNICLPTRLSVENPLYSEIEPEHTENSGKFDRNPPSLIPAEDHIYSEPQITTKFSFEKLY